MIHTFDKACQLLSEASFKLRNQIVKEKGASEFSDQELVAINAIDIALAVGECEPSEAYLAPLHAALLNALELDSIKGVPEERMTPEMAYIISVDVVNALGFIQRHDVLSTPLIPLEVWFHANGFELGHEAFLCYVEENSDTIFSENDSALYRRTNGLNLDEVVELRKKYQRLFETESVLRLTRCVTNQTGSIYEKDMQELAIALGKLEKEGRGEMAA